MFIADGHHRYETACNYRDELAAAAGGSLPPEHPANFVLMMFISMSDPGLIVMPTHRLFRGLPKMSSAELIEKLGPHFTTRVGRRRDRPGSDHLGRNRNRRATKGRLAYIPRPTIRWVLARLTDAGRRRMAEVAPNTARLARPGSRGLASAADRHAARRQRPAEAAICASGRRGGRRDSRSDEFPLAALVMPATVEHIRRISQHGERMPAKSTYFYPKLLSGLVINPLE